MNNLAKKYTENGSDAESYALLYNNAKAVEDRVNSLRSMTTDEFVGMFGERIVYLTSLSYVRMLSCMYQITGYRGSHIYADLRNEASCKLACKIMDKYGDCIIKRTHDLVTEPGAAYRFCSNKFLNGDLNQDKQQAYAITYVMANAHRTLQQSFFRVVYNYLIDRKYIVPFADDFIPFI